MSISIRAFVRARLEEESQAAHNLLPGYISGISFMKWAEREEADMRWAAFKAHRPSPTTNTCEGCGQQRPCDTMRHLAAKYANHPEYSNAWAPRQE